MGGKPQQSFVHVVLHTCNRNITIRFLAQLGVKVGTQKSIERLPPRTSLSPCAFQCVFAASRRARPVSVSAGLVRIVSVFAFCVPTPRLVQTTNVTLFLGRGCTPLITDTDTQTYAQSDRSSIAIVA